MNKERLLKEDRIVCDCYKITVADIRREFENGNDSFEKLKRKMRLGVLCSACVEDSNEVVKALEKERSNSEI